MHEVAALTHPVDDQHDAGEDHDGHDRGRGLQPARPSGEARRPGVRRRVGRCLNRIHGRVGTRGIGPLRPHAAADDQQHPGHRRQDDRQHEHVRAEEIGQIGEALVPLGTAGVLRDRGIGNQQGVVAHAEDLVADRQSPRDHDDAQTHPPAEGREEHQQQDEAAEDRQFGPDQRRQTGGEGEYERGRRAPAARVRAAPRPGDELAPQDGRPEDAESVLEPARGEVARGRNGDVDDRAERQQQGPAVAGEPADACPEQARAAVHRDRDRGDRADQRHPERDVLELTIGDPRPEPQQVGPGGRGVRLDPLTGVEDRAVAGEEVAQRPQDDESVVGDPPALPRTDREERRDDGGPDDETDGRDLGAAGRQRPESGWRSVN